MRSSCQRSMLNSPQCQSRGGGARRHPHPGIDVPRPGRQAPAWLSTKADKDRQFTHTNCSPIFPVHFRSATRLVEIHHALRPVDGKQHWTFPIQLQARILGDGLVDRALQNCGPPCHIRRPDSRQRVSLSNPVQNSAKRIRVVGAKPERAPDFIGVNVVDLANLERACR